MGPNIDPCGTPQAICAHSELILQEMAVKH